MRRFLRRWRRRRSRRLRRVRGDVYLSRGGFYRCPSQRYLSTLLFELAFAQCPDSGAVPREATQRPSASPPTRSTPPTSAPAPTKSSKPKTPTPSSQASSSGQDLTTSASRLPTTTPVHPTSVSSTSQVSLRTDSSCTKRAGDPIYVWRIACLIGPGQIG